MSTEPLGLSAAWSKSYESFNPHPATDGLSDTQCDFAIACVGAKRSAFCDGTDWQYNERDAAMYDKATAARILARLPLFRYCRLVRQPKPGLGPIMWPTVRGWHMT